VRLKKKSAKVIYDGEIVLKHEFEKIVKCFPSTERAKLKEPDLRVRIEGH
jgi:ATP-dependent RNA circularization protein (DNA/RNA ligase family)